MRVDILPREAQRQETAGDQPAVAPAVEAELVLVTVIGVAIEIHDHPPLDHQVHLANSLDLHPVFETQPRGLEVHSCQRLQRGTSPVAGAIESCERPSRSWTAKQVSNLLGGDALIVKCCVKSDERRVVLDMAAQKTSQRLRKWLHRETMQRRRILTSIDMENLTSRSRKSPTRRDDEMNLLAPLSHGQPVVAHGGLTGEKPTVDARQDNGTLSTWDTDNPVLIGDELTGPHERGDVTALGASQLEVPYAYRSVAAAHSGEQLSVHGVHGAHCRPLAERAQPGAGALWTTGASVNLWPPGPDMSPPSETSRPGSPSIVSKSVTKEPSHLSPSNTNRGITRFHQAYSAPATAFVADLDTLHRSKALCTSGTALGGRVRQHHRRRAHPDQGGAPHVAPPPRPSLGRALFCRAGPT